MLKTITMVVVALYCFVAHANPEERIHVKVIPSANQLEHPDSYHIVGIFDDLYDPKMVKMEVEACDKMIIFTFTKKLQKANPEKVANTVAVAIKKICGW